METKQLKIIIFDGSFKTTTFINRLVLGLLKKHKVYILGFNNKIIKKLPKAKYIDLGSSQNFFNLIWQTLRIALQVLLKNGSVVPFFKAIKNILTLKNKQLQQDNFNLLIQLIRPDIIHVQWPSLLVWCEHVLLDKNVKVVLSQRGYQSNVRPFVNRENFKYLQKWYPKIDGFHSVSKAISEEGNKIFNSPTKIDSFVYSGFDFNILPFLNSYHKKETLQLLSVGRPHWIKGYSDAIKACKILLESKINFTYTIVGCHEKNEELLYLINDFKLHKQIRLLPNLPQSEVYKLMQASCVLLFPSVLEGLPNVVVESMALGLPVVSTKCGGVEEVLNKETGWLVSPENPKAIAFAINEFIETPVSKIDKARLAARLKVEAQHSIEQMVLGMEKLYFTVSP